jgi:hypothetical protein
LIQDDESIKSGGGEISVLNTGRLNYCGIATTSGVEEIPLPEF